MAKKEKEIKDVRDVDAPYSMSGKTLYETRKARDLITCTLSSDTGLGGGIPRGSTVLLGGIQKSGKSTFSLQCAANAQKKYKCKIFYCNIEGRLDNKVLSQINNIDLENLEVIMGPPIYDKTDKDKILGHRKMSAQQWWTKIGELITQNPGSVIIVDSISALSDESELAEGMGHMSRGGLQKLEAQFQRQYGDIIVPSQVTLFLLAHIQANTSGYGDPLQIKCGNSIRHMADAIIFIRGIEKWKPNVEGGRILGHNMKWRIECSPLGPQYIETSVPLRFGNGIDVELDIIRNAQDWGIIKLYGSWYVLPFHKESTKILEIPEDKEKQADFIKIQGEEGVRNFLKENNKYLKIIEENIRQKIFI